MAVPCISHRGQPSGIIGATHHDFIHMTTSYFSVKELLRPLLKYVDNNGQEGESATTDLGYLGYKCLFIVFLSFISPDCPIGTVLNHAVGCVRTYIITHIGQWVMSIDVDKLCP